MSDWNARTPKAPAKAALVTGAARRVGRDIALRLAREGYSVAVHYRDSPDEAAGVVRSIIDGGGAASAISADLSDPLAAAGLVEEAARRIGPMTLLVNSAAMFEGDGVEGLDLALWRLQFAVNLETPVFLSGAFAKALGVGLEGAIVNIIDHRVLRLNPRNLSYTLSKSALWTATQTLAQALAPRIRVNAIGPGPTYPNKRDGAAGLAFEVKGVPLERRVTGEDIAEAVVYLANARNVTGQLIAVDAGQHLGWRTPDVEA